MAMANPPAVFNSALAMPPAKGAARPSASDAGSAMTLNVWIMPKTVPGIAEPLALTAVGGSTPTLARFDDKSDKARWNFRKP